MLSTITDRIVRQGDAIVARIKYRNNQPPVHPKPNQQPSDCHQEKACNDALSVGESLPALSEADKRSQNTKTDPGKEKRKPYSRYELSSTILNGIFAAVTAGYCFCEYYQWQTMQSQLREMRTQTSAMDQQGSDQATAMNSQLQVMRDQAQAMKDQVSEWRDQLSETNSQLAISTRATEAAEKSVSFAQESFRRDQRAWIGIDRIITDPPNPPAADQFEIRISFINAGKTPAKRVTIRMGIQVISYGTQPDFTILNPPMTFGICMPNEKPYFGAKAGPLGEAILDGITTKKQQLYVYGIVMYDDIFNTSHWTEFSGQLVVPSPGQFAAGEEYNDCDDHGEPPPKTKP